jgi:hypothetical protein
MANITFSYPIPPKSIGGFVIDCFFVEHYSFSNSVTEIPIEDGSLATDHIRENADEIQIKAYIGNTEFIALDSQGSMPETAPGDPKERIKAAYQELLRLKRARQPLDVVTGLDTFHNMGITTFDIDREASTGANLPFDMSFKTLNIVKSKKTTINSSTAPAGDQTAGTANLGTAGTNKVDPASDRAREEWRQSVDNNMASREEYQEKWGVPYPQ